MKFKILGILAFVLLLLVVDIYVLPSFISPFQTLEEHEIILYLYRIPKSVTAVITGASLAVSGFVLQQLFKNQLAGPYILGVSSGASLMVSFFVVVLGSQFQLLNGLGIPFFGILGALGVLMLMSLISFKYGNSYILLLFGVIIGMIVGALQNLLTVLGSAGDLKTVTLWSMGSFSQVLGLELVVYGLICGLVLVWIYFKMPALSIMVLGNDIAKTMGVNTKKVNFQLLISTGVLAGVSTAYCGPIAFIGIAIPNVVKLLFKTVNFKLLLFANLCMGASMALVGDILSSIYIKGINLPLNVTTALIGGPFIIYVLLKQYRR